MFFLAATLRGEKRRAQEEAATPRFLALLVGHSEPRFQQDVMTLKAEMESCNIDVAAVPGATAQEVIEQTKKLVDRARSQDVVIFYTTGHGGNPSDSAGDLQLFYGQSRPLSANVLREELRKIKSKKVLIIIHSCFAGAFPVNSAIAANKVEKGTAKAPEILRAMSQTEGHVIIFAGPPDKVTYGNVFPAAVRNSFRAARQNGERLRWSKLLSDVSSFVEKQEIITREGYKLDQFLQLAVPGGRSSDFDLYDPSTVRSNFMRNNQLPGPAVKENAVGSNHETDTACNGSVLWWICKILLVLLGALYFGY